MQPPGSGEKKEICQNIYDCTSIILNDYKIYEGVQPAHACSFYAMSMLCNRLPTRTIYPLPHHHSPDSHSFPLSLDLRKWSQLEKNISI